MFITFFRTIILYFLVVFGMRLMGKRQLAELQVGELATAFLISNIATLPFEDTSLPIFVGIIPILTLISIDVIMSFLTLRSKALRDAFSGSPVIVIKDGVIDQRAMFEIRFSPEDLLSQLREKDIFNLKDVSLAIVEPGGTLSIYKSFEARELTSSSIKLEPQNSDLLLPPAEIIINGKLNKNCLDYYQLTESWVKKALKREGIALRDVYLMTCDQTKNYQIITKERVIK